MPGARPAAVSATAAISSARQISAEVRRPARSAALGVLSNRITRPGTMYDHGGYVPV